MYRLTLLVTFLVIPAAWGIGLGVGALGGAAIPVGASAGDDDDSTEVVEGAELATSPVVGARVVLGVLPFLDIEGGFAFHTGHHPDNDDWKQIEGMEEPVTTVWPITVGANIKAPVANAAFYGIAGVGYYLAHAEATGEIETPLGDGDFKAELDVNEPGFYLGGGFEVRLGDFGLHADSRYHFILNDDEYDADYTIWINEMSFSDSYKVDKDFNDTFVNVTVGVDYYFL